MIPPLSRNSRDDYQTPLGTMKPLLPFLSREWHIWECAAGKGNLVRELEQLGYTVHGSDIHGEKYGFPTINFLTELPDKKFDCIITNPPFSCKRQFLERCYELGKPFALLLPITALETRNRQELFRKYGLEIILFDKRINFETPSGGSSSCWFASAWFTNWLGIGRQITFAKI